MQKTVESTIEVFQKESFGENSDAAAKLIAKGVKELGVLAKEREKVTRQLESLKHRLGGRNMRGKGSKGPKNLEVVNLQNAR